MKEIAIWLSSALFNFFVHSLEQSTVLEQSMTYIYGLINNIIILSKPLASYHAIPRGLGSILASSILFY
jgi:hypothetical protein